MKKRNKVLGMASVAIGSIILITGCGTQPSNVNIPNTSSTPSNQSGSGQLVMATSADYPPYEFHNLTRGSDQIEGFDIDVANQIAKDLGFTFTVKDMTFDGLIGALQSKRADFVLAGMTPTPQREKNVDFSMIYYTAQNAIVESKGGHLTSLNQLAGKTVGVQTGSTQETDAQKIPNAKVVSLDTIPTIIQELKTGRIDAAIIESTVAKGFVANNPDLTMHLLPAEPDSGSAVAFPKGSKWVKPFNQELAKMKADGELNQLIVKWFGGKQAN